MCMLEVRKCDWNVKVMCFYLSREIHQQGWGYKAKFIPRPFQATVELLPGVLNVWKLDAGIKNRVYWPCWRQSVPPFTVVERKKSQMRAQLYPFITLSCSVRDVAATPPPQVPSSPICYSHKCFSIDACTIFAPYTIFLWLHREKPPVETSFRSHCFLKMFSHASYYLLNKDEKAANLYLHRINA